MQVAAASTGYPLLELFWTMLLFFGFVVWVWLLFVVFADVFGRRDIGGWGKAGWIVLLVLLPLLGVLVYLVAQGREMATRRVAAADAVRATFEDDVRSVVAKSRRAQPTEQIAEAKRLLDSGAVTDEEYELLKRRALAPAATDRAGLDERVGRVEPAR